MDILSRFQAWMWMYPLPILILGVGLFLTILLRGLQFRFLFYALKLAFFKNSSKKKGEGDISHFQSLMTALAATVGIGNIAGVATAVVMGGLGAIFWIWVMALICMSTRFAESILAIKYRVKDPKTGEMSGGPMYFIDKGLGWKPLAAAFAIFTAMAAVGGGNLIQSNSVADAVDSYFHISPWWTGSILTVLTLGMLFGGIKRIALCATVLVPFMAIFYLTGGFLVIGMNLQELPHALASIVDAAFTGQAAIGGFMGATVMMAIQYGMARGVSSTEACLGSGAIAAAAARTDYPGRQAMVSMTGTLVSAFLFSTMTGLVLAVSGILGQTDAEGRVLNGAPLTIHAFEHHLPGGGYIVVIGMILFAYTTIIGWAYYGEKSLAYLFGPKSILWYRIFFSLAVLPGAVMDLDLVWRVADITNGLMVIPNVIGVLFLWRIVREETNSFLEVVKLEKSQKHLR